MEDYDLLIDNDGHHGFCVLFANKHALSKEEIEATFSQFGCVCNVRFHGSTTGICFVRYKQMDGAVRAVDNLRHHPKIRLLGHNKKKQRNHCNSETNQNFDQGQQQNNGTQFTHQFSRQTNQQHGNFSNDLSGGLRCTNENQKQNDVPWGSTSPNGNQKPNDVPQRSNSPNKHQKQNGSPKKQKSPNGRNNGRRSPKRQGNGQGNYDRVPDLVDHNKKTMVEIQNQENEIPELVTSKGKKLKTSSPIEKVILAEEVIVANIHPKFGAPYILHLFDRFEPLAITSIMVEPRTGKRYCHVYFKSLEDSQRVETAFDKKLLLDQKLIVIRSSQLVETAYFK